jgi:hypothetical protein
MFFLHLLFRPDWIPRKRTSLNVCVAISYCCWFWRLGGLRASYCARIICLMAPISRSQGMRQEGFKSGHKVHVQWLELAEYFLHLTACGPFAVPQAWWLIMHARTILPRHTHRRERDVQRIWNRQGGKWPAWREQLPSWGTYIHLTLLSYTMQLQNTWSQLPHVSIQPPCIAACRACKPIDDHAWVGTRPDRPHTFVLSPRPLS